MRNCDSLDSRQVVMNAVSKASAVVGDTPQSTASCYFVPAADSFVLPTRGVGRCPSGPDMLGCQMVSHTPWHIMFCLAVCPHPVLPRSTKPLIASLVLIASLTHPSLPLLPPPPQALQSLALDPVFLSTLNTWLADLVVERSDANLHVLKQVLQLLGLLKAATWAGVTASGLCVTVRKAVGHRNRDVVATATALIKVGIRVHGGWGQEGRHCAQTGSLQQTWAGGHMCASIYAVVFVPACVCPGLPARACWFVGRCCLLSHPPLCCCMWLL